MDKELVSCAFCERQIDLLTDKYRPEVMKKHGIEDVLYLCEKCCNDIEMSEQIIHLVAEIKKHFHHKELEHLSKILDEADIRGIKTCIGLAHIINIMK